MENAFHADALDDCLDFFAGPVAPSVAPVPPGFIALYNTTRVVAESDAGFLSIVAPDLYELRASHYRAVPGARKALDHSLHQTGVL